MSDVISLSNHWKYQLGKKTVDVGADIFIAILMDPSFVFDPDVHATLADVLGSPSLELPNGNGYTQQNKELSGGSWAENDTSNKGIRTFDDLTWTATGGSIGPFQPIVIYDNTTSDDTVVGCITCAQQYTVPDGSVFKVTAPVISNS